MSYRPKGSVAFGPPFRRSLASVAYLALAVALGIFVVIGSNAASSSWMFRYVVEQDAHRVLGSRALTVIMLASAVSAVVRSRMRGVVVHPEGLETRDLVGYGWPRVRRFTWAQIDRIVLDPGRSITVDLWDGSHELLPDVAARAKLEQMLEGIALARAIPLAGGRADAEANEGEEEA